jgi:hypothetical protein
VHRGDTDGVVRDRGADVEVRHESNRNPTI